MSNMVDMRETIYRPSWVQSHGAMTGDGNYYSPSKAQSVQYAKVYNSIRRFGAPAMSGANVANINSQGLSLPPVYTKQVGDRPIIPMHDLAPSQYGYRAPFEANINSEGISLPPMYASRVGYRPIMPAAELAPRQYQFGSPLDWLKSIIYRIIDFIKSLNPFGTAVAQPPLPPPPVVSIAPGVASNTANTVGQASTFVGQNQISSGAITAFSSPAYFGNHTSIFSKSVIS